MSWALSGEVSMPIASGVYPAETAAADPPEEPPTDLFVSDGSSTWPPRDE